ncbi:MAG TPA: phosphoribosyl-AMP cyclohydrolase [Candidatus Omnitrophota bacterium]|nr:MAG: phosphoribosyl-AMP cyclohydrolase [Candidatus Omnitrophica bacterium ADurb.Bin314]HOE69186.1 phosphoribosyl-AMP cyclohydrolase [Candidatus Omnitrophota bacterium]HQB94791.1 phosphoribosyl-AMP cyclohydrolase [Candidatus Omnitrophota bacterium]
MENLKFNDQGLLPAIIQDSETGEVLMLAYVDQVAIERTLKEKHTVFYSRSRNKYWVKGEESGHTQSVVQVLTDCDKDTLLIRVTQKKGGACHLGYRSCFVHEMNESGDIVRITQEKVFDPSQVYKK